MHFSFLRLWQLQGAARRTAEVLDKMVSGEAAFEATFLLRYPPTTSYDYFWRICPPPCSLEQLLKSDLPSWRWAIACLLPSPHKQDEHQHVIHSCAGAIE
jgi:hypothetical protein